MTDQETNTEFKFKLELLKEELNRINSIIDKLDNICQTIKYWSILIFIGVSTAILGSKNNEITKLIIITPFIPITFWIVDATWRRHQNRAMFRSHKISEYLNSSSFVKACAEQKISDFTIWDPMGREFRDDKGYKRFTSVWRMIKFKTISRYYLGLILTGIFLSIFTYVRII